MKEDIKLGALLPTITLSASLETAGELKVLCEKGDIEALAVELQKPGGLNILDGLQRTYILNDLRNENHRFIENQTLHLEVRLEENLNNLIYRIIVLNAGQKPMSMRHQIEVLFSAFKDTLERDIPGLELFSESESSRRTRSRKYALDRIATAYHAFLLKSTEVEKQNVVAQKISEESVLAQDEEALGSDFLMFRKYLEKFASLDDDICRVYDGTKSSAPLGTAWFGGENVMNAFFAAISDFGSNGERQSRIDAAIASLTNVLKVSAPGDDPLGLESLQRIIEGFPVRKVNVGFATRKLLSTAFKEYFRDEGQKPLSEIWEKEAE
jgi:hypothetical protein